MLTVSEYWQAHREAGKAKRKSNIEQALKILELNALEYTAHAGDNHLIFHLESETIHFWPSTGLWKIKREDSHRGVWGLVRYLCKAQGKTVKQLAHKVSPVTVGLPIESAK